MSKSALKAVEAPAAPIASWEDVDNRMLEIGRQDLEIAALENERQKRIQAVEEEFAPRLKAKLEQREADAGAVVAFAQAHREDVAGKTWKGSFGKLQWSPVRESIDLLISEEKVINRLKVEHPECVRIKESLDKDAMKAIPADERKTLGFRIVESEEGDPKLTIDRKKIEKFNQSPTTGSPRRRASR